MIQLEESILELEKELEKLKNRLAELEKHKTLVRIQRARIEEIERTLERHQVLILFDYTKYNYLCHDLVFVLIYKDTKNVLQRKYVHYLHSKWDKSGCKVPNDGKYTITAFKLFFQYLNKIWISVRDKAEFSEDKTSYPIWKDIFLASDGGPHFVNAAFMDYLTRLIIQEYNRYGPHHGGNYADGEFGICKTCLRRYEQKYGQMKTVEGIINVLRMTVKNRDAEFFLLDKIDKELEYTYKSSPFPDGIKGWFSFQTRAENHKLYFSETGDPTCEWNFQIIKAESIEFEDSDEGKEEEDDGEDENDIEREELLAQEMNEVFGTPVEENNEVDCRYCFTCEEIIDENSGFLKCTDAFCPRIYHYDAQCYKRSWKKGEGTRFRCKDCYRGRVGHLVK